MRVEARVVQQRRGAAQPGAMNALRADFDQPEAAVHQTSSPGARVEPVLGLEPLAAEVALAVQHRLGLAGRARRERDQARVVGRELGRRRRLAPRQLGPGRPERGPLQPAPASTRRCARRQTTSAGSRDRRAGAAGRRRAAARCTAARRSPGGSTRPSSAPTPAGCRAASARRRRGARRARASSAASARGGRGDLAHRPLPPRCRRARARPARGRPAGRPRRRRGRSSRRARAYGCGGAT